MLTLYRAGNSICTQKIVITLFEEVVPRETVNINLFKSSTIRPISKSTQRAWAAHRKRRSSFRRLGIGIRPSRLAGFRAAFRMRRMASAFRASCVYQCFHRRNLYCLGTTEQPIERPLN